MSRRRESEHHLVADQQQDERSSRSASIFKGVFWTSLVGVLVVAPAGSALDVTNDVPVVGSLGNGITVIYEVGLEGLNSIAGDPFHLAQQNEGESSAQPAIPLATGSSAPKFTVNPPAANAVAEQAACIAKLPDDVKLGQKIIAAVNGTNKADMAPVFAQYHIGGAIDMGDKGSKGFVGYTGSADALQSANQQFVAAQKIPMLFGIDQEGGTVQKDKINGPFPSEFEVAQTMTPDQAQVLMTKQYTHLKKDGYNAVFAPDLDELGADGHSATGDTRSFSASGRVVTQYAQAYVSAADTVGIMTFGKHAPGGLSLAANSDNTIAISPMNLQQLDADGHLDPYKNLAKTDMNVMASSLVIPGLTDGQPFSLSRAGVTDVLRGKLGYGNKLIVTDDLSTPGVNRPIDQAMLQAWEAGVDMGMTVGDVSGDSFKQIIASGETALQNGQLNKDELNASVGRIFANKKVNACTLNLS